MNKTKQQYHDRRLYMIEGVDVLSRKITLADYICDKKVELLISFEKAIFYANAFYDAIEKNIFLFLEFDEAKNKIIANEDE
jgi:hypothetical protein